MPELPEVETVKNTLKECILNKTIKDIKIFYNKIIDNKTEEDFKNSLINQTFLDIQRRGKYLIFILNDYYLISHLRMEGKYFLMHDEDYSKHDHIVFIFDDSNLRYNDTRKFGRMFLYSKKEYNNILDLRRSKALKNVGKEVFDDDIDANYLLSKLKNSRPIKTSLLDQSIIAGLGNIYVDEVLFMCKIHPLKKSSDVTKDEAINIINNSIVVLNKAIKLGGTTIRSFESSHGISGRFQNELLVHTKTICPICNSNIEKIRVGGRGTYLCPKCQKIK